MNKEKSYDINTATPMPNERPMLIACTDLSSNSVEALRQAARMAGLLDYQIRLVFVVNPSAVLQNNSKDTEARHEELRAWANDQLRKLHATVFDGLNVEAAVVELHASAEPGSLARPAERHAVAEAICKVAKDTKAEMIVLGTHGESGLSDLVVGTVLKRVVRLAPCDVYTARPNPKYATDGAIDFSMLEKRSPKSGIKSVLCAIDFSPGSKIALEHAVHIAKESKATLHVMHTYRVPFWMGPGSDEIQKQLESQVKHSIEESVLPYQNEGINIECEVSAGRPSLQIHAQAQKVKADLIVMGVLGQTDLADILVGSVTERVIRIATSPVLAVRQNENH
ncbi:MAG: universal stress protein [Myxococcales bacterium]|nr:MAG: universal stress protein [Myxococcales bacterium]